MCSPGGSLRRPMTPPRTALADGVRAVSGTASVCHQRDRRGMEDLPPATTWRDPPPIHISPQLRKTGAYERRGKPNQVRDRTAERELLRRQAEREAAETAAARQRLGPAAQRSCPTSARLDTRRSGCSWRSSATPAARKLGNTEIKTTTSDAPSRCGSAWFPTAHRHIAHRRRDSTGPDTSSRSRT